MLTTEPTEAMLAEWKAIFQQYRPTLTPNRKSGTEVNVYFREKYDFPQVDSPGMRDAVTGNILYNEIFREKLADGQSPEIVTYASGGIVVGIDLTTGFFQVECEEIEKVIPIFDDLFAYRGLDEKDLQNVFLVAEYVRLKKRLQPPLHPKGVSHESE